MAFRFPPARGMRLLVVVLITASLGLLGTSTSTDARAQDQAEPDIADALDQVLAMERELVKTCEQVRQLTVSVWNLQFPKKKGEPIEGAPLRPVGGGSGVLIERKRKIWVVTNVHVIQGADQVQVITADGEHRIVDVHDTIRQYDIALLSFPKHPRDLRAYTLNPSKSGASRELEEGAWVVATGNPFHLATDGRAVTTLGVVSGKDRILGKGFVYGSAIQHDAEVNPGNSGGPLWNRRGQLVGINGMISVRPGRGGVQVTANTGASFSIPIHQVNAFLMAMIEQGTNASAGHIGIEVETALDEESNPRGARVTKVYPWSPAGPGTKKGLKEGDVITVIWGFGEDHRVHTASDVTNLLSLCRVGTYLKIRYRRGKRSFQWSGRLTAKGSTR